MWPSHQDVLSLVGNLIEQSCSRLDKLRAKCFQICLRLIFRVSVNHTKENYWTVMEEEEEEEEGEGEGDGKGGEEEEGDEKGGGEEEKTAWQENEGNSSDSGSGSGSGSGSEVGSSVECRAWKEAAGMVNTLLLQPQDENNSFVTSVWCEKHFQRMREMCVKELRRVKDGNGTRGEEDEDAEDKDQEGEHSGEGWDCRRGEGEREQGNVEKRESRLGFPTETGA